MIGGFRPEGEAFYNLYRGDSFICQAAIHAGFLSDHIGGSGLVTLVGEQRNFSSSLEHGIQSTAFAPSFPMAFTFDQNNQTSPYCRDPRWAVLGATVIYTFVISMCTCSASAFFWPVFVSTYFCVALAADAPEPPTYNKIISLALKGFLPAIFVGFTIFRFCIKRTMDRLKAPMERTSLWLGSFWVGALNNLTFDKLPLQRLLPHDLVQPGAILSLTIMTVVVFFIAIGQVWALRLEGRLPKHLLFYIALGVLLEYWGWYRI